MSEAPRPSVAEAPGAPASPVPFPHAYAPPGEAARQTAPRFSAPLVRLVELLDALFDRAYGARWNPAQQSGGLAVALMLVAVVTGVYLMLVYRIGSPYESMQAIQAQAWGGRWIRALHRYVSDVAVVAVGFHALRMMAEGRTWGPRVLAWVTGLLLTGTMLVVGWTGYVLVWDDHARMLGGAGARLMDSLHVMATPIGRIFSGDSTAPASFFFLNLFVHMAIPLAMVALLWVHTLRLARSRWLPERRMWLTVTAVLTLLSIVWPATLGPSTDGLTLGDRAAYDVFYTAWIPFAQRMPAPLAWAVTVALVLVPLTATLWWRPARKHQAEPSHHNPLACTGCGQCVVDCPFEAISMVPNLTGRGTHTEVASVDASRCVSCGLCSGSCDQLAIGPPGRDGHSQVLAVRPLLAIADPHAFVLVHCAHDGVGEALAARARAASAVVVVREVDCVGSLHTLPVQQLVNAHRGVFVLGCPPSRCHSREGTALALDRLLHGREPFLKKPLDITRVRFASGGRADLGELAAEFERFMADCGRKARPEGLEAGRGDRARRLLPALALTAALLAGTGWLSQVALGSSPASGGVRLAWRLPGQSWLDCRPLTPAEIAKLPAHMRKTEDCRTVYLHYRLRAWVDGELRVDRAVAPLGARGDRPLFVEQDITLAPGAHELKVEFEPLDDPHHAGLDLEFEERIEVTAARARLVTFDADAKRLVVR